MASFAVDYTEVKFAATNTGYKDITITGMPQAGVNCTITGTDVSSFGFRIPGSDQNVYRVYTTSHSNIGTNANKKTATFKITNLADSTDYVEVSLVQVSYYGYPAVKGVKNVYDNIYAYYLGDDSSSAFVFAEYTTDNVGTYTILYVDGYEGTTTLSGSWASYTEESAYTDTGFKQIKIGATNSNNTGCRKCNISFPGTGGTGNLSILWQNPYPSSTSGCTSPIVFSGSGGTERITLKTDSQPAANIDYHRYSNDGLTSTIVETGGGTLYYDVTVGPNQSDNVLKGAIMFERGSTQKKYGFALVSQDASSGQGSLSISPTSNSAGSASGSVDITVTSSGIGTVGYSISDGWIRYSVKSGNVYTFEYDENSSSTQRTGTIMFFGGGLNSTYTLVQAGSSSQSISASPSSLQFGDGGDDPQTVTISNATGTVSAQPSANWISVTGSNTSWTVDVSENVTSDERTGTVTFTDDSNSTTVSVWQDSPSPVADITVTPRTLSFSAEGGSGTLDVTYTDTLNTNISSFPSWLSMTETSSSEGESTFSVTASQNGSTEGRSFAIEFSNGLHTVTATVNQGGHTSSFSVTPESLTFGKEGGSSNITLINPPSNSINWEFTYDDGSGWADISFSTPTIGTVTVTQNSGERRTASLKIWNWDFPDDYVLIPITQYGEGYYSIWNDLPVSPSSFTQGEDYHYRISSGNTVLFEGITVPIDSGSLPVPVNIPRIVESYIHSGNPEDIIPDLVLHKLEGDLTVSLYDLEDPSSPVSEGSYSFWNDWSGVNEVYDRTVTLNDPINGKGCPGMIIPFCICSDDGSSFSVDEGRPTGTVTHTLGVPQDHFSYAAAVFAAAGDVSLKDGDGNILTSYDMTHCGQGYLLYRNRYGGWDSFLIEGNIYSYDGYERLDAVYPSSKRKVTDRITIRTRYEINTGWMNDEESGRLVYHLLSSPTVGLDIFGSPSGMIPVTVTVTQAEYKKFRNGRKMVSYTITLEENKDKTVQR